MTHTATQMMSTFFHVSSTDPEDARRRRLLNILIAGVLVICALAGIAILIPDPSTPQSERILLFTIDIVMLGGVLIIYFINRHGSGTLASTIFITLVTLLFAASDTPQHVVEGRSLFYLVVPILMSSVLLRPYSSFIVAIFTSIVVFVLSVSNDLVFNSLTPLGFMMVALVSWLSARSLERALYDLQKINQELDQRVADRTRDLAESLQREQAESSKNQAILESIADGVVYFDTNNKVLIANPSLVSLIGDEISVIEGKTLEQLMQTHVPEEGQTALLEYRDSPRKHSGSIPVEWNDKTLSINFAPVVTASGDEIGRVMVCRDFTREAELDRLKDRFLSMTSHELRTPLNAILGYTDMMQAQVFGELSEKQDETIHRITANAKRMLGLVNNILDQAHIEAGTISLLTTEVKVKRVVDDVYSVTEVLANHRGLSLEIDIEDDVPPTFISDEQRLIQILLNLMGNAIKFTKEGSVTLHVYRPDTQNICFAVRDTGVGIPTDAQQYVFDAFRQVDDPSTRDVGGSGLGLSIVKQLVALLEGTIKLESKVGKGTTFTLTLPEKINIEEPIV